MDSLKVLGKKKIYIKKNNILCKIHQGYIKKKLKLSLNIKKLSKTQLKSILFLKKKNLIFFFKENKFNIIFINKDIKYYNFIILKYFENKPFYIY